MLLMPIQHDVVRYSRGFEHSVWPVWDQQPCWPMTINDALLAQLHHNSGTTGSITLSDTSTDLPETSSLMSAFAGTITEYTGNLTVTDGASVSELDTLNVATTGL